MLLHGSTLDQGTVVSQKRDTKEKVVGSAHDNPIVDTQLYDIEFGIFKVTIFKAMAIDRAM